MNEFEQCSSVIRDVLDLKSTTKCIKPVAQKCLEMQRKQYLTGVIQIILVSILLLVLALSLCVLVHMNTEFAKLKERVDILERSKQVHHPSEINKSMSIQQNVDVEEKVTPVGLPSYYNDAQQNNWNVGTFNLLSSDHQFPMDEIVESSDSTRFNKRDIQNMNISVLGSANKTRENITESNMDYMESDIHSEKERYNANITIKMDEAKSVRFGGQLLHNSLISNTAYTYHDILKNRKNILSTQTRKIQNGSTHIRNKRTTGQDVRKSKPQTRNIKRHAAAIHLNSNVLDNVSGEHRDCSNQDCYIYKAWTPSSWTNVADFVFLPTSGRVQIKKRGLYYIYAQILYHNAASRNSFEIMINDAAFVKCMTSVDWVSPVASAVDSNAKYKNCYTGGVTMLTKNQEIYIKDGYGHITDSIANFFGIIKISDA